MFIRKQMIKDLSILTFINNKSYASLAFGQKKLQYRRATDGIFILNLWSMPTDFLNATTLT